MNKRSDPNSTASWQDAPLKAWSAAEGERSCRWLLRRVWIGFGILILALACGGWIADTLSREGERTIYTVVCTGGDWDGERCTGKLRPEARVRFKASKERGEVTFWSIGEDMRQHLSPCSVVDGRNWVCFGGADAGRSITLALSHGRTQPDSLGRIRPSHPVPKWRWWLLRAGIG